MRPLGLLLVLLLTGCSASSTFVAYPSIVAPLKVSLMSDQEPDLDDLLVSERQSNDKILYNLERGRVAQTFGRYDLSRQDFTVAIDSIKANDQKATVSVSQIGANLAAMLTNDNALPYEGEGYERVLLHHYQALNYLFAADLEGAGVEFRWANQEQGEALKRHADELEESRKEGEKKDLAAAETQSAFQTQYAQLDEVAGKVKNSFQNAYSFYLSGLVYELQGEENDAYIDYKKALEIYPDNRYLQQDVLRLARRLGMQDDYQELRRRFNLSPVAEARNGTATGELVVFFEDGFVPQLEEVKLPFALPAGLVTLALPFYQTRWSQPQPLALQQDGILLGATESICDVRALAVKSLQERMPIILTRQLLRAVAKIATQKAAREKFGDLGQLVTMAYSHVSENADLRSWTTLPESVQILRLRLPAGTQRLSLQHPGSLACGGVTVEIRDKGRTILMITRTGTTFHTATAVF